MKELVTNFRSCNNGVVAASNSPCGNARKSTSAHSERALARLAPASWVNLLRAGEVGRANLAALVEDEVEADGHVEVNAEDIGLNRGAEADGGVEVDEPLQQGAALVVLGQADLDEAQNVSAHPQLQRVDRAAPAVAVGRRRDDWAGAVGCASVRGGGEEEAQGQEEGELCSHW
uniref:Uncharacterized protein n=1 Tax=Setaria italica TaxID=4555 RepID=K4AFU9_SETIT